MFSSRTTSVQPSQVRVTAYHFVAPMYWVHIFTYLIVNSIIFIYELVCEPALHEWPFRTETIVYYLY